MEWTQCLTWRRIASLQYGRQWWMAEEWKSQSWTMALEFPQIRFHMFSIYSSPPNRTAWDLGWQLRGPLSNHMAASSWLKTTVVEARHSAASFPVCRVNI